MRAARAPVRGGTIRDLSVNFAGNAEARARHSPSSVECYDGSKPWHGYGRTNFPGKSVRVR